METTNLSKDIILNHYSETDIFIRFANRHNMQLVNTNDLPKKLISSPFTIDKKPSFSFYSENNKPKFKCNSSGKQGDAWQFVADLSQLDCKTQFSDVLKVIANEMIIDMQTQSKFNAKTSKSFSNAHKNTNNTTSAPLQIGNNDTAEPFASDPKNEKKLHVTTREFRDLDLLYWSNLGVNKSILEKFNVSSISSYHFTGQKPKYLKNEAVGFAFELDGNYKLYIPEQRDIEVKKNVLPAFKKGIFGLQQLGSKKIENIIVCEGEKDTIVANSRNFNTVSFGSCTRTIMQVEIDHLQTLCHNLFICYDNDVPGKKAVEKITKSFPRITPLHLPESTITNYDLTDYFQDHTTEDFQKIIDLAVKNKTVIDNEEITSQYNQYELPKELNLKITDVIDEINNYGMFMANNQIWIMKAGVKKNSFYSVSNYEISILQHLQDEKYPIKLISAKNTNNEERVFDVPADSINTPTKLANVMSNQGNFQFYGNPSDFNKLNRFLLDKMGIGKKIEVLGWQDKANIWVWNNKVNLCNGSSLEIDKFGCFNYENRSYYVPSANKYNEDNEYHYEAQKKFVYIKSSNDIKLFISKVIEVHEDAGISAILFTISSLFSDIIYNKVGGFPLLFLYGRASSGKTQLAYCCQRFLGKEQTPLNLENGVSTKVAQIRELSQFRNGISHLAEYKPGNKDLDGVIKGIWDRNGYKRGVKDSNRGTDTVPIESTAILTGNYYPNDEALITRLIWLEMQKSEHTKEDKERYYELENFSEKGISFFSDELLNKRHLFISEFYEYYKQSMFALENIILTKQTRIHQNLSILFATFKIFEKDNIFPFNETQLIEHFKKITELQMSKLKSADMLTKWWDCFLICFKSYNFENKLTLNEDIKLESNILSFQISNTYGKIQRQWYSQYKENIPPQSTLSEALKRDKCYIETKNVRLRSGGIPVNSIRINLSETNILEEFLEHYNFQISITNHL